MSGNTPANGKPKRPLVKFLLENRSLMNYFSILMIIYAVWATVEVITNASGASWWPPETGIPASEIYNNPDNIQTINNGWVICTGAVLGTGGTMIQYFYRAAPYVDASMQATAALIISAVKKEISNQKPNLWSSWNLLLPKKHYRYRTIPHQREYYLAFNRWALEYWPL